MPKVSEKRLNLTDSKLYEFYGPVGDPPIQTMAVSYNPRYTDSRGHTIALAIYRGSDTLQWVNIDQHIQQTQEEWTPWTGTRQEALAKLTEWSEYLSIFEKEVPFGRARVHKTVSTPKSFRKKHVSIVQAMQITKTVLVSDALGKWSDGIVVRKAEDDGRWSHVVVDTLEGSMRGELGDYVIRGVYGEFYPCKQNIFETTYEEVEDE